MSALDDFEVILGATQALRRVIRDEVEEAVEDEVGRRVERALRRDVYPLIAGIEGRLTNLGVQMSALTEAVANVKGAVNEAVTGLDSLADRVKNLEAGNDAEKEQVARELNEVANNLRGAVANPDLPDAEPGNGENPDVPAEPGEPGDPGSGDLPPVIDGQESPDGGVDTTDGEGNPQPGTQNA